MVESRFFSSDSRKYSAVFENADWISSLYLFRLQNGIAFFCSIRASIAFSKVKTGFGASLFKNTSSVYAASIIPIGNNPNDALAIIANTIKDPPKIPICFSGFIEFSFW